MLDGRMCRERTMSVQLAAMIGYVAICLQALAPVRTTALVRNYVLRLHHAVVLVRPGFGGAEPMWRALLVAIDGSLHEEVV